MFKKKQKASVMRPFVEWFCAKSKNLWDCKIFNSQGNSP